MVGSVFKFGADTTEYNKAVEAMPRKMRQAAQQIEANTASISSGFGKLQNVLASVGVAFSATVIVGQLRRVMEHFDRVNDLAIRFGTSAESIQRVGEAARLSGSDIDMVARAMTKAGIAATEAVTKGGEAADTFRRAGINAGEFERLSLDQKLLAIAQAFKAANGDASKQNEILKLIGMRAADLIPLITNIDGLKAAINDASVVSDEAVRKISDANDRLEKLGFQMQANVFAPAIIGATDLLARIKDINANAGFFEKYLRITAAPLTGGASLFAGGKTPEDRQREADTQQAISNLVGRGQLPQNAPTGMTMRQEAERELLIQREVLRIEAERAKAKQDALDAQRNLNEETSSALSDSQKDKQAAEEKKALMQEIARINLQIKEAQAAGNDALAADLTEFKDLLEAGIKYEGDMEMAARDVNAAYKERLRLKDEELLKQKASIDAELERAETAAFGTEEAKAKAEWMDEYNRRIKEGATDEQARRFANAKTFDSSPGSTASSVGGGFASTSRNQSALDRLRAAAETDPNARAELMRLQDREARDMARADRMRSLGRFGSAARTQMAAEARAEASASREMQKQTMQSMFGARNVGDAFRNLGQEAFRAGMSLTESMSRMGIQQQPGESQAEALQRFVEEQSKTEAQRKEEAARGGGGGGAGRGASDPMGTVIGKLEQIIQEITDRLPQNALAA